MHDAFGRELKVGDKVMIPMVVKAIYATSEYCNVQLQSVATMPPAHESKVDLGAVNTQQVLRANEGDSLEYLEALLVKGVRLIPRDKVDA